MSSSLRRGSRATPGDDARGGDVLDVGLYVDPRLLVARDDDLQRDHVPRLPIAVADAGVSGCRYPLTQSPSQSPCHLLRLREVFKIEGLASASCGRMEGVVSV